MRIRYILFISLGILMSSLLIDCADPFSAENVQLDVEQKLQGDVKLKCSGYEVVAEYEKGEHLRFFVVKAHCESTDRTPTASVGERYFEIEYGQFPGGWEIMGFKKLARWTGEPLSNVEAVELPGRSILHKQLLYGLGIPVAMVLLAVLLRFVGGASRKYRTVARKFRVRRSDKLPHQTRSYDSVTSVDEGSDK